MFRQDNGSVFSQLCRLVHTSYIHVHPYAESPKVGSMAKPGEAPGADYRAWTLDFKILRPDSVDYAGVDADMSMKLTSFWFFANRPTVGALIGLGTDMAAATDVPDGAPAAAEGSATADKADAEKVCCAIFKFRADVACCPAIDSAAARFQAEPTTTTS